MNTNATAVDVLVKEANKTFVNLKQLANVKEVENDCIQDQLDAKQLRLLAYYEMLCQRIGEYVVKYGDVIGSEEPDED